MGWYIFGNLLPNPATNAWDRGKILLLTGDFFEELKKNRSKSVEITRFCLVKTVSPHFFQVTFEDLRRSQANLPIQPYDRPRSYQDDAETF